MPGRPKHAQERDAQASQQKILDAAEAVFAEKGFDGARVDEIAKRAGVNKALLYYYFESKEQLLRALTDKHFAEMAAEKQRIIESPPPDTADLGDRLGEQSMAMLVKRQSFLRIIAIEALKNNGFAKDFFRILDSALPHLNLLAEQAGLDSEERARLRMNLFYFGFAPVLLYLTTGEDWAEDSGIDELTFGQHFLDDFRQHMMNLLGNRFRKGLNKEPS